MRREAPRDSNTTVIHLTAAPLRSLGLVLVRTLLLGLPISNTTSDFTPLADAVSADIEKFAALQF